MMMLVIWKQQGGIGKMKEGKKPLTAKEFDKKYPHLKDHADYKNYGKIKKLSVTNKRMRSRKR